MSAGLCLWSTLDASNTAFGVFYPRLHSFQTGYKRLQGISREFLPRFKLSAGNAKRVWRPRISSGRQR
jgi:hypothetical protein